MAQGLEAGRAHVGAGSAASCARRAQGEGLIAQAVAFGEQEQGRGIDFLDADRGAPAPVGAAGGDEEERLVVERDLVELVVVGIGRDHRPVERAGVDAREQAVGQVLDEMERRRGSASIAPAARRAADRARPSQ